MWIAASLVFAAVFAPWLYGWGKDFAATHAGGEGFAGWLGGSCERAKFSRYFNRALMFGALILFFPLWMRVRAIGRVRQLPAQSFFVGMDWKKGAGHAIAGFAVAAGLLGILCVIVLLGGAFEAKDSEVPVKKLVTRVMFPAVGASFFEEWMFRGILLGLWLRVSGPRMACLGTALVFAFVHFLEPSGGGAMTDPRAWHSGFGFLGLILADFANPRFVAAEFLTLLVIGLALGWARLRTGSLWMPVGMHAGWVFAYKLFNLYFKSASDGAIGGWLVGETLMVGMLPLTTLILTWLVLAGLVRILPGTVAIRSQPVGSSLLSSAGRID